MARFVSLQGNKYGRLLVISRAPNKGRKTAWLCQCDCGKMTTISGHSLTIGHSTSCGCYRIEQLKLNPQIKKETDPEILRQRQLASNLRNYFYLIKKKYGLTKEQFEEKFKKQNGQCAICKENLTTPHVDHDHVTEKTRDLLCHLCNHMLGMARESISTLEAAIRYLKEHKNESI